MNKSTFVIDGHFMAIRICTANGFTFKDNPEQDRKLYIEKLSQHLVTEIKKSQDYIDNIIIVEDFKSWRKSIDVVRPIGQEPEGYKAHRKPDESIDWNKVWNAFEEWCKILDSKFNVAFIKVQGAEGDDLLWMTSRWLKNLKTRTIIYCSDSDANQMINDYTIIDRKIKSKLAPYGEIVVHNKWWKDYTSLRSKQTIFNMDISQNVIHEALFGSRVLGNDLQAVNPYEFIFYKCIQGDKKDNVPGLWSWRSKTGTTNRYIGDKHILKALEIVKPGFDLTNDFGVEMLYDDNFIQSLISQLGSVTEQNINLEHSFNVFKSNRKLLHLHTNEIPAQLQKDMLEAIKQKDSYRADMNRLNDMNNILDACNIVRSNSIFSGGLFTGVGNTEASTITTSNRKEEDDLLNNLFNI